MDMNAPRKAGVRHLHHLRGGIGKSRLLYEFRKAVTNEDVTFLEGRCLSYSTNIAYHPIVDILKANFEIQDNDTGKQVKEKVTNFLKLIQVDEPSTLPYLLELLSVKESGIEKIQMSPEARKDRTLEALKKITLKGSELRPLIMAVEDLHWMDRSSEDALKQLLESISDRGLSDLHLPAGVRPHLGQPLLPQPGDAEPAFQP